MAEKDMSFWDAQDASHGRAYEAEVTAKKAERVNRRILPKPGTRTVKEVIGLSMAQDTIRDKKMEIAAEEEERRQAIRQKLAENNDSARSAKTREPDIEVLDMDEASGNEAGKED